MCHVAPFLSLQCIVFLHGIDWGQPKAEVLFGTDYFKEASVEIQILWNTAVERICCEIKLSV
jgi:hypothetical protein